MYQTLILQMIKQRRELAYELKTAKKLMATVQNLAKDLKARHQELKTLLIEAKPGSDENLMSSEALEIALKEIENALDSSSEQDESGPLSLDGAMAFARRHTPPA